ncbi:hypothetical protein AKJ08_0819 [Vulgatibacter incomptus]|uniref:Uncharacterized protein n=1 Tax=Vulgatibacter incomptus TaxID=1391653 RepID=A0A0K1PAA4_9BACT|nr:hypothetical protein AKJ08_0819 [Vulgatibacter incomptus]
MAPFVAQKAQAARPVGRRGPSSGNELDRRLTQPANAVAWPGIGFSAAERDAISAMPPGFDHLEPRGP